MLGAADDGDSVPFFDPAHPEGIYLIHLDRHNERDIAVELITACKACTEGSLMKDIKLDGVPNSSVPDSWPAGLAETGMLEFAFVKSPESPGANNDCAAIFSGAASRCAVQAVVACTTNTLGYRGAT